MLIYLVGGLRHGDNNYIGETSTVVFLHRACAIVRSPRCPRDVVFSSILQFWKYIFMEITFKVIISCLCVGFSE